MHLSWDFLKKDKSDGLRMGLAEFNATVQRIQLSAKSTSQINLPPLTSAITESVKAKQELLKRLEETDSRLNATLRELTQVIEKSRNDEMLVEDMKSQVSYLLKQKETIEKGIGRVTAEYNAAKARYESEIDGLQTEKGSVEATLSAVDSNEMKEALKAIAAHQSAVEECITQMRVLETLDSGQVRKPEPVKETKPWLSDSTKVKLRKTFMWVASVGLFVAGGHLIYLKTTNYLETQRKEKQQQEEKVRLREEIAKQELAMKQKHDQEQQALEKTRKEKAERGAAKLKISSVLSDLMKIASGSGPKSAEATNVINLITRVPEHMRLQLAEDINSAEKELKNQGWRGNWKEDGALNSLRDTVIYTLTGKVPDVKKPAAKPKAVVKAGKKQAQKVVKLEVVKPQVIMLTEKQQKKILRIDLVREAADDFGKERLFTVAGPKTSDSPEDRERFIHALGIKEGSKGAYEFEVAAKVGKGGEKQVFLMIQVTPTSVTVKKSNRS